MRYEQKEQGYLRNERGRERKRYERARGSRGGGNVDATRGG